MESKVSVPLVLVISVVALSYGTHLSAQPVDEVNFNDVLSEGLLALFALVWVIVVQRLSTDKSVYVPLILGFSVFFLGIFVDVLDELYELGYYTAQLENVGIPLGMLFTSLGLYRWSEAKVKWGEELKKEVMERRKAESILSESEARFRSLFESSTEGIIIADFEGKIVLFNKGASTLFGYSGEEVSGKPLTLLMPERYREDHQRGVERYSTTGKSKYLGKTLEFNGLTKYGEEFPLELTVDSYRVGDVLYYSGIIRDITERKKAEEAIKKYAKDLEESNQMKDLFSDIMHHDILNPAGAIRSSAQLLEAGVSEGDEEILDIILQSVNKQIDMINSAHALAKLEPSQELEMKELDLKEIIENAVKGTIHRFDAAGMVVENNVTDVINLSANPVIEDIFLNFLSNAAKYAPEGKRVVIGAREEDGTIIISVKDYGGGIPDDFKEGIFDRFQRRDKKGVKGTGLGMAIAKRIVELHHGRVWVEDNPEGGSIFKVSLPLAKEGQ